MVVDALDAGKRDREEEEEEEEERGPTPGPSQSIAQLLGSHLQLLPPWLLLVCSARSHSKGVLRLFPGEEGSWGREGRDLRLCAATLGVGSEQSFPRRGVLGPFSNGGGGPVEQTGEASVPRCNAWSS